MCTRAHKFNEFEAAVSGLDEYLTLLHTLCIFIYNVQKKFFSIMDITIDVRARNDGTRVPIWNVY